MDPKKLEDYRKRKIEEEGIKERGKLELLVIEDNPEFLEVAKKVYGDADKYSTHYASSFEEAIDYLEANKVDVVVSDLFFPSKTDFRKTLLTESDLEKSAIDERNFHEKNTFSEEKISQYVNGHINAIKSIYQNFLELNEIPSGLEIARYCSKKNIPFCIVSQGDRHEGDLAIVRGATSLATEWIEDLKLPKYSSFPSISVYEAGRVDKNRERTWIDAIDYAYKIKEKIDT